MLDLIDKVEDLVKNDCHATLRMSMEKVNVSVGILWTIVHETWLSESVRALGSETAHYPPKRIEYDALQCLFRYHENLAFLERQQVRC